MKTNIFLFAVAALTAVTLTFTSCKQEDKSGNLVVWWNQALTDSAQANGLTGLKIYIDNEYIGNYTLTDYWTGEPNCGDNGSIGFTKNLGQNSSANVTVQLKNAADESLKITANATINASQCSKLQLVW